MSKMQTSTGTCHFALMAQCTEESLSVITNDLMHIGLEVVYCYVILYEG